MKLTETTTQNYPILSYESETFIPGRGTIYICSTHKTILPAIGTKISIDGQHFTVSSIECATGLARHIFHLSATPLTTHTRLND